MAAQVDLAPIMAFLPCATPVAWIEQALEQPDVLLIDHANCEKKAASTALNLLYRYVEYPSLLRKLSRLAREELRHFEQVTAIMQRRGVVYAQLTASRYAGGLRQGLRSHEPARLIDTLVIGALIEARSCERFAALAPHLDEELSEFYLSLLKSEARHFSDYLNLATEFSNQDEVNARVVVFAKIEAELIESPDKEFRFHSGLPSVV
jgi:tRNA-(ms[2]io[6]A)-hydroxylase